MLSNERSTAVVFVCDLSLAEAIDHFLLSLNGAKAPATEIWYRRRLLSLLQGIGNRAIGSIMLHDLRAWRAALVGNISIWSLHGYLRAARRFFRWLVDEGILDDSPASRLELPRLPKTPRKGISDDARDLMLAAARDNPRDYALVWFLIDTLCRVGGILHLHVEDVNLETGDVTILEKGSKSRLVFIRDDALAAMRDWLKMRNPTSGRDLVFAGSRGPLTYVGIYQILKRLAKKAGVESGWNPHNWRHGGARGMLQSGAPLGHVSQYLGHSDIKVTNDFYGTFAPSELKEIHRRYGWRPQKIE